MQKPVNADLRARLDEIDVRNKDEISKLLQQVRRIKRQFAKRSS
jgi:hypothetical protein